MSEQIPEEPPEKRRRTASNDNRVSFNYEELAKERRFQNTGVVLEMDARNFTMEYVRQSKLKQPILFTGQLEELGMKIPNFDLHQILQRIPKRSYVYIIESSAKTGKHMPVGDFVHEFNKSREDRSKCLKTRTEISYSKVIIANLQAPSIIRQINWKETIFPRQKFAERKLSLEENFLAITMAGFYEKFVRCVRGTTFYIHVKSGKQYYFLIEPTSQNFEKIRSYDPDSNEFFGGQVSKCTCICVEAGQTLLIPTSWIFSTYTSTDTIAYLHYFYHDFSLGLQLELNENRLNMTDDEIKNSAYNNYVFIYQPILWYFIADIVKKACKRDYVRLIHSEEYQELLKQTPDPNKCYNIKLANREFYDEIGIDPIKGPLGTNFYKFTRDPIQETFERVDKSPKLNKMIETFDDDYLRSWDQTFYKDLSLLHSMFVNIIKDPKNARVAEGIRRPNHLLADFKRILDRYNELQHADLQPESWQIKQETISLEKDSNTTTEVIQLDDESELDNSSNLNGEVEQPTSTINSEPINQQMRSTFTNSTTLQKLANLEAEGYYDFVIRAGGKQFKIFKLFLMCQSDVLKAQLADKSVEKIEFDGISSNATEVFIDWIHTGQTTKFTEYVEDLYKLASKYNIVDLKTECIKILKASLNEENFCQRLILAFEHDDQPFQQHVIDFTKQLNNWRDKLLISDQWIDFAGQNKDIAKAILNRLI